VERPYRVVVIEDDTIAREIICTHFTGQHDFEVVACAADGMTGVSCIRKHQPDLVVVDFLMPRMNGPEVVRETKALNSGIRALVLTAYSTGERLFEALDAGVDGYVVKEASLGELLFAARNVLQGNAYLSPQVTSTIIAGFLRAGDGGSLAEYDLTSREAQVFKLTAEGHTNKEMAALLCLSDKSVEKHIASVRRKLHVETRSALVNFAVERGLVLPG